MSRSLPLLSREQEPGPASKRRRWRHKFRDAFRGLKLGVRGQPSFFVHFFLGALVVVAAFLLGCDVVEWCVLLGCIGTVMVAELFNSAIETLFRGLDESAKERVWPCLDIAAGAVLLASLFAAVIGGLIFLVQLARLIRP